jgi:hypothetical protein
LFCSLPSLAGLPAERARGYERLRTTWVSECAGGRRRPMETGTMVAGLAGGELRVEEIGAELVASCDPHGLLVLNINTPHDYERAQRLTRMGSKSLRDRIMDVSEHS